MLLANFHLHIFLKQAKNTHNSCPFVDYRDTLLEKNNFNLKNGNYEIIVKYGIS